MTSVFYAQEIIMLRVNTDDIINTSPFHIKSMTLYVNTSTRGGAIYYGHGIALASYFLCFRLFIFILLALKKWNWDSLRDR
jgi:hypothetical protein